ncbi:hypothetical protein [Marinobacterium aestuariivivens]|uniref:Uncharacterized protein n=1 Tax=Marinobacterium aestuariivivens TaxID=1698799 RepID=A0ABW2A9T8_9GAMM
MNDRRTADWDPRSPTVLDDQIEAYDEMRRRCPMAHSEFLNWTLFRHRDLMRVLADDQTFSNAVSSHLSIPNGLDPPSTGITGVLSNPISALNGSRRSRQCAGRSPST